MAAPHCIGPMAAKLSTAHRGERWRSDATKKIYVIVLQPEDLVLFRNPSATALRKACNFLRWEIVADAVPEAHRGRTDKRILGPPSRTAVSRNLPSAFERHG